MKSYLLLLLSMLLLLFVLPHNSSRPSSFDTAEQVAPRKLCSYSNNAQKRPCARKCLQHQTHRTPQSAGSNATACGVTLYAVIAAQDYPLYLHFQGLPPAPVTTARKHLSPDLPADPNPPRFC